MEPFKPKEVVKQCLERLEGLIKVWNTFDLEWLYQELTAIGANLISVARYLAIKEEEEEEKVVDSGGSAETRRRAGS